VTIRRLERKRIGKAAISKGWITSGFRKKRLPGDFFIVDAVASDNESVRNL